MPETFFEVDSDGDGEHFSPTQHTRGPWDPGACHAGPPTALIARAAERAVPDKRLARLTVDLLRPIPMAGFRVAATVIRPGRSVANTSISLVGDDGRECATATGLHIRLAGSADTFAADVDDATATPDPDDAEPGEFPIRRLGHGLAGFPGAVAVRYPAGDGPGPGPTTVWMSAIALLPDEEPSPFQRICPLADCGNAFSRHAEPWEVGFVNADLSIWVHREPHGEWLGMRSTASWHADGTGVADSLLFDAAGTVGRAAQTLLLTPPPGSPASAE